MKHFLKVNRSRWLLLTLFTLIVGISPAWGDSEDFESLTVDGTTLSNGWFVQGGTLKSSVTSITSKSSWENAGNYDYEMITQGANSTSKSICNYASSNSNKYLIIPVEVTGKIRFYAGGTRTSGSRYVKVYRVTYDSGNSTYSIGTQIGSAAWPSARGSSSAAPNWLASKQEVDLGDDHSMVAFLLQGSAIDEVEYEVYVSTPYVAPASISVVPSTTSAIITWTAGATEETVTAWNLEYKKSSDDVWSEVHGIAAGTLSQEISGLNDNTDYDVRVKAIYGTEESVWKTTTFKTPRAPITSFPWSEDFTGLTSGNIPDGWDNTEGTTTSASYKWTYYSSGNTAAPCLRFNSYNNSNNNTNFLKTPIMSYAQNANMQLKFWYKNPAGGDFSVYISNDGGATYTEELASGLTGASSWTEKVIDLPTDVYYDNVVIVFKGTSNYGSGDAYIYLDDILVKENASYAMSISGEDVVSNAIAFGEVKNTSTTKTFTISNDGANDLTSVSVVSSDASVFTVSDTDFDIASGETKDITVTFVKGVVGDYDETITVSQANVASPIVLAVTGSYATPTAAVMAVKVGEEVVGETIAFGNVGKTKSKTITVVNTGEADLNVTSITSSNTTDFTVSPSTLTVHGGSSETFTVTFVWDGEAMNAEKSATITVTASNAGVDPKAFTVTGTRVELWSEDFSGGSLPEGWENDNTTYWTFTSGVAQSTYNYTAYYLTTPSLIVEEGESLSFDACLTVSESYRYLTVQKQKNNGSWESCMSISYSEFGNTADIWKTFTIEGLSEGKYKFRFQASGHKLDNFEGFKRNLNDPKMGIYTDVDCTVAAATSVTKDFGFVTENATQIYYIKNDGTGTLTLDQDEVPAGFSAVLGKTSLAKDESTTLTITFGEISGGYRSGNIVVNGSDGSSFTVAVCGVKVDNSKLNLNFATDNIPSTWTANDWMKDGGGYLKTGQYGYSNTSMETSTLVAEAGEQLVIVAKNGSSSNTYTFGVKYKQVGAAEWSDLIPAANIGTSWTTLRATIAVPGNYVLQFNGYYASIQRIYGLTEPQEPVMAVYDDEVLAGASYDFGNVSDEADATWTLTVKNEGKAKLTGLVAALSGDDDDHYTVTITGATGAGSDEIEADAQATITVTQLKDNLGSHSATLTISADDPIEDKVITLSGFTYDHNKLFVDFESGMPSGWTVSGWNRSSANGNYFAQAAYSGSNTLTLPILTVAANEELSFDLSKQYNSSTPLTIRYTTNGGVDWTETDLSSYLTYGNFTTRTLSLGNTDAAVTALIQFVGSYYSRLDNFYGGSVTTAPVLALTESAVAVVSGSTKAFGNLTEDGVATYTLTNNGTADMVSVVSTTGVATAVISGEGEGVTLAKVNDSETYNKVTLAAGKSATITLTVPFVAPYGSKAGAMTIDSEGWVGDMVVNYTATTIDPTALYEDFSANAKPAGWYVETGGWTFTNETAHVYSGVTKTMVTEQYAAEAASSKNVLSFDAKLYSAYAEGELKVYTSSDRKTWTLKKTVALTEGIQAVSLDALADGNYYVKFESSNASIDNLAGLKRILPAPAHDLYVTATTFPTTALVPNTLQGVTATATVASLRANETGVYAKLFFDEDVVATAEPKAIDVNSSATFDLSGTVPATEKTYAAKIIVYYSDESVAWETGTVDVEVAHTRTLSITEFTREGAGEIDANASNQFSAAFNVTVQNTGSTAATPVVKIFIGETEVGTATADAAVAAGGSKTIAVNVTDASAGEGGELEFTAKAYWTAEGAALATSASNVTITVNATAPKFALYQDATPVNDGDDVDFGLVKGTTETFSYTIKNEGSADLVLKSIVAPAGFTATEVTEVNKTIAPAGTLAMDVTLNAEQGKVSGNLVITYRVDAMTDNTFTLALTGRSVAADTWTEDFESGSIPANWTNDNGWTVGETDGNHYATRTGWDPYSIMTPRLAAAKDEELTFDVLSVGNTFSYAYSTDKVHWSDEVVIDATGEQTFTAPAAGNYYLRFTTRNGRLDNLVGFRLNPLNLTLNESSSNSFIAANYDNVTLNRAFIAGWNTVCLPFAIDDIEAFFGTGAYAYAFDNYTDGNITFAKQDAMDAATPYLVFVPEAIASKELKNLVLSDAAAGSVGVENTFTGTYAPIAAGGLTNKFVLTPQARIQKAGSGATMNAFRAYFTIPSGEVKALLFDDGTATSVLKIDINGNEDVRDIFDLAGRKLNETRKGVNIVNGKKVLVK